MSAITLAGCKCPLNRELSDLELLDKHQIAKIGKDNVGKELEERGIHVEWDFYLLQKVANKVANNIFLCYNAFRFFLKEGRVHEHRSRNRNPRI